MKSNRFNVVLRSPGASWASRQILKARLLFLACVFVAVPAFADVRLPAIVGDNMMLQQRMGASVWGWADPGETVTVAGSWGSLDNRRQRREMEGLP
jgi:hypothetical protein